MADYAWADHRYYLRIAILIIVGYLTSRLIHTLAHKLIKQ